MTTVCPHHRREFFRSAFTTQDGEGAHVVERCLDCRANARGSGQWVGKQELRAKWIDPETLAADPWQGSHKPEPQSGDLFGAAK